MVRHMACIQESESNTPEDDRSFLHGCEQNGFLVWAVDTLELIEDILPFYLEPHGLDRPIEGMLKRDEEMRSYRHESRLRCRIGAAGLRYYDDPRDDPFWDFGMDDEDAEWSTQYLFWYLKQHDKDPSEPQSEFVFVPPKYPEFGDPEFDGHDEV